MTCSTCNCSPCRCQAQGCEPTFLNQPRIINPNVSGGIFTGGTFNAPTINGGTSNGQSIVGATIDCTTQGCTQGQGVCDSTLATTAFVCGAVSDAVSGSNPAFCTAVQVCLAGSPALCTEIINCINTTPGSIFNVIVFDPAVFSTTLQVGVIRIATLAELQGASCGLAIDPCTLQAFFAAGGPNPLWNSFAAAVDSLLLTSAVLCTAVFACGAAPLNNPVFTGDPQAPTPAPGDNDGSIATTNFVNTAIVNAINAILGPSPAFCAAVVSCGGGGGGGGGGGSSCGGQMIANGSATQDGAGNWMASTFISGATYGAFGGPSLAVTFASPQPDTNYSILLAEGSVPSGDTGWFAKTVNGFVLTAGTAALNTDWAVVRDGAEAGPTCPGNFAAVRVRGTSSDGINLDGITIVTPLYGCAAVNGGAFIDVTFNTPQPDTFYGIIPRTVSDVNGGLVTNSAGDATTQLATVNGVNSLTFQTATVPGGVHDMIAIFTR